MAINEQGLDDLTQQLRIVEAHPGFRAIFVLSRKTLIEQGRDVSRALRNRCLELSITFNRADHEPSNLLQDEAVIEQLDNLAAETLDTRNLDWSLAQYQTRFDLLPGEK